MPPVPVHRRSVACSTNQHGGATRHRHRSIRVGAASCLEDGLRFVAEVLDHLFELRIANVGVH
jgi:hypothetical protein